MKRFEVQCSPGLMQTIVHADYWKLDYLDEANLKDPYVDFYVTGNPDTARCVATFPCSTIVWVREIA